MPFKDTLVDDTDCLAIKGDSIEKGGSTTSVDDDFIVRRRLKRKLDSRLVVWAFLGYFASYLDRSNLQNAYVSGMKEDLDLDSAVYNWADAVMRIGYNLCQIPMSLILPRTYPRWLLSTLPIAWGTIQCCMSFVRNHQGLLALRFCLGLSQSIFQPGVIFLLGSWYTEDEIAKRVGCYKSSMGVSGAVGGLIAGSIVQTIANRAGLRAWQWLFLVEGLISVFVGLIGYLMVPNYPHQTTSWITEDERLDTMGRQISRKVVLADTPYTCKTLKNALLRPYAWLLALISMCAFFLANITGFFVIILKDIGYDSAFANYMSTPLNLYGALVTLIVGWSSDRFHDRAVHIGLLLAWGTIWNVILATVNRGDNPAVLVFVASYALNMVDVVLSLAFVWTISIYKCDPNSRALALALVNGLGLLVPSFVKVKLWVVTDSPTFWLGKVSNIGFGCASVLVVLFVCFLLRIKFMLPEPVTREEQSE